MGRREDALSERTALAPPPADRAVQSHVISRPLWEIWVARALRLYGIYVTVVFVRTRRARASSVNARIGHRSKAYSDRKVAAHLVGVRVRLRLR